MKEYVIIVAGGSGKRMNADIPKQFLLLKDEPILMHTIRSFSNWSMHLKIILVLPNDHISLWKKLCTDYQFEVIHELVTGGKERFHSVQNGLARVTQAGVVAVHDGVRPLVSTSTLKRAYNSARIHGSGVPVMPLSESLRELIDNGSVYVERSKYRSVQTPQCFKTAIIKRAYDQDYNPSFTDDASVVEAAGNKINLVDGNQENIKITTPFDLIMAEALLTK